jgi:hypothetical protein
MMTRDDILSEYKVDARGMILSLEQKCFTHPTSMMR